MKKYLLLMLSLVLVSCENKEITQTPLSAIRQQYPNVINMTGVPLNNFPKTEHEFYPFVDLGAWHAHYLPSMEDTSTWGGFTGPLYIAEEYGVFLSKSFAILELYTNNTLLDFAQTKPTFTSYPGGLFQNYQAQDITIDQELIFINNRTSLVKVTLSNKTDTPIDIQVNLRGTLYSYKDDASLEAS